MPLQIIELNLILKAVKAPSSAMGFWKLLVGTVLSLRSATLARLVSSTSTWTLAVAWLAGRPFFSRSSQVSRRLLAAMPAYPTRLLSARIIVSLGWCTYTLGYFFGVLQGTAVGVTLNVVYNIADFVNKIAFVLDCWSCAKEDSEK